MMLSNKYGRRLWWSLSCLYLGTGIIYTSQAFNASYGLLSMILNALAGIGGLTASAYFAYILINTRKGRSDG